MSTIVFRGYHVWYCRRGRGEPVIFLHNAGCSHRVWDHQIEHFRKTHAVYAIDLLGHGFSESPDVELSLQMQSDMLGELIKRLGLGPVTIVGSCLGSAVALRYTLTNPSRVRGLVLFNPLTRKTLAAGQYGKLERLSAVSPRFRKLLHTLSDRFTTPRWVSRHMQRSHYGLANETEDFLEHLENLYTRPEQLRLLTSLLCNMPELAALDQIQKPDIFPPVFSVWGRRNTILPVAAGKQFWKQLEPERAEIFETCGHLVMREVPDRVNQLIDGFIASLSDRPPTQLPLIPQADIA